MPSIYASFLLVQLYQNITEVTVVFLAKLKGSRGQGVMLCVSHSGYRWAAEHWSLGRCLPV
jgi:hypothetical protein